ncbi:MAG: porin [Verrucomicrobiota bacterium]
MAKLDQLGWGITAIMLAVAFAPGVSLAQTTNPNASRTFTPLAQAAADTNGAVARQLISAQTQQAELIQELLGRLEQLERKDLEQTQRTESVEKAHQEEVQKLLGRIGELEGKVGSLESGKVLPEIAVSPKDGPTANELDQKIRVLARNKELAAEAAETQAAARAKETPRITAGANGFAISSADTNFVFRLRGIVQLDSRSFFADNPYLQGNDGFYLRRARPIIEGTVFRDFDFNLTPEFGGNTVQIYDAYMNYRYEPELQLKAGKFKGPVGFEMLQSDATLPFNERSLVTDFVPIRSLGVQLWGDLAGGAASYAAGVFNGSSDGRVANNSDFSDGKEFAGRLAFQPFKNNDIAALQGVGFGAGGSYSQVNSNTAGLPNTTGGTLPGYVTSALQQFFAYNPAVGTVYADGAHWRVSPYGNYTKGPFGLLGEYIISRQGVVNSATSVRANLVDSAWQASVQWVLTGEDASFTGITPKSPFDPRAGKWGAWQLVARFAQADLDSDAFPVFSDPTLSAPSAMSWGIGLNWWLNKNVRVLTSYSKTWFEGGGDVNPAISRSLVPPATVTHQDENVFMTRLQLAF